MTYIVSYLPSRKSYLLKFRLRAFIVSVRPFSYLATKYLLYCFKETRLELSSLPLASASLFRVLGQFAGMSPDSGVFHKFLDLQANLITQVGEYDGVPVSSASISSLIPFSCVYLSDDRQLE